MVLLSGPSLAISEVLTWAKCFKHCLSKCTISIGVSTPFLNKKVARNKIQGLFSGPIWPFASCNKLGPDHNPYLDQIITPRDGMCCLFDLKCAEIPIIQCFLNLSISFDNFSYIAKHRYKKERFVTTLDFTKIGVL